MRGHIETEYIHLGIVTNIYIDIIDFPDKNSFIGVLD